MGSLSGVGNGELQLPKVNMSELDMFRLDKKAWVAVREVIAQALKTYGAFEVVYDRISPELREDMLGLSVPDLFDMPAVGKLGDDTALPYHGWLFRKQGFPFFALQITEPNSLLKVQDYANTIWPPGNVFFSNTVWNYSNYMQELIKIIHRMILEDLGLENHYDSHMKSLTNSIRLTKYDKDISYEGVKVVKPPHKDPNYVSIIFQHKVEGLEIETLNGEWIQTTPLPNSFTVLLGEAFTAWTNGRLQAPIHRVKMNDLGERYSAVFSTVPTKTNDIINVPDELVDEKNPLSFKPFKYYDYVQFRFSNEGEKFEDDLKVYCGI